MRNKIALLTCGFTAFVATVEFSGPPSGAARAKPAKIGLSNLGNRYLTAETPLSATPNSASAASCLSRFCSLLETRAYPHTLGLGAMPQHASPEPAAISASPMRAALSSVSPPAPECAASEAPPPCLPSSPSAAPVALPPRAFAPEPAMPPPACVAPGHPRGGHIPAGSSHLRPSSQAARQPDQPRKPHGTQSAPRRYHALQNPTGPPHTPLPRATHGIMQPNRTKGGANARSQPASA